MRRAAAALIVTAVAVVLLARYETEPPMTLRPETAQRPRADAPPALRAAGGEPPTPPRGTTALGPALTTPFSAIQVRATVRRGRLVDVTTVALTGDGPHTDALNARAEPILREEALRAGSADIDVVTGATATSESWIDSLKGAIRKARRG